MQQNDRILIGQIYVDSKVDWETLRNMIDNIFKVSTAVMVLTELLFNLTKRNTFVSENNNALNRCDNTMILNYRVY